MPEANTISPAVQKAELLRLRDLAMLTTAARYDLSDKADTERSVRDLARLFFHLAEIIDVDLFIEAGAKDAEVARRARRRLGAARVVAFEANPYTYAAHVDINAAPPAIEYEHLALSDTSGVLTVHVRRSAKGAPIADGQASLLRREDQALGGGFVDVEVEATTLDDYFRDCEFARAAAWIDVEGAARMVLSGGSDVLDRTALLLIEVEDRRYWGEGQWLRPEVLSFLYDRGLVPVARDYQSRYLYNIVLVRADLLDDVDRARWALALFSSAAYGRAAPAPTRGPATAAESVVRRSGAVRLLRRLRQRVR